MFINIEVIYDLFEVKDEQVPDTVVDIYQRKNISLIVLFYKVALDEITHDLELLDQEIAREVILDYYNLLI